MSLEDVTVKRIHRKRASAQSGKSVRAGVTPGERAQDAVLQAKTVYDSHSRKKHCTVESFRKSSQ